MKLNNKKLTRTELKILIDHFNYSIKDINSYDEFTEEEKKFIDKNLFNKITDKNE